MDHPPPPQPSLAPKHEWEDQLAAFTNLKLSLKHDMPFQQLTTSTPLQTVRCRGIQKTLGMVCRVDEQCGVAGALRCVNFMFFFLLIHQHQNILQKSMRIFIAHPHPLCLSLPKTSGRVLHHWPSPFHCSRPSSLNKHQDNTVNDEHMHECT